MSRCRPASAQDLLDVRRRTVPLHQRTELDPASPSLHQILLVAHTLLFVRAAFHMDSRLQFRTFLQPAGATLTAADIEEVIETIEIPAAAEAAPALPVGEPAATGQPPAPQVEPVIQERRSYQLSQEKKIELFLSYINRMVDLLFQ